MRLSSLAVAAAFLLAGSAPSLARPSCAGPVEIANARLLRIERNGAIVLTDGQRVHLEGIRLAGGASDHAPSTFADQALVAVQSTLRSGPLTLTSVPPLKDRYDRIRVQAFVGKRWVQDEILRRGLARVSIAPDRTECAIELFTAEAEARATHSGIWSSPAYAIRTPDNLGLDTNTFQIVEGKVLNASVRNGRVHLNFGENWRTDFTATVDPADKRYFREAGVDPTSYVGQTIRVRGWVQSLNGPEIEVPNPQGIEVVK
jgi:endonuclease YncB( thermonuclease family)